MNHKTLSQSESLTQGESPKNAQSKIYKPQSLSHKLIVAIFALMILVQCLSIAISAVFLNESHKGEMFADLENYANHLSESLVANLSLDSLTNAPSVANSHYRISIIELDGKVIFDNKIDIAKLDNHLQREEVQNIMQGKNPKIARLSDSQHKENLYFTRFIEFEDSEFRDNLAQEIPMQNTPQNHTNKLILRVSTEKDSLFAYLLNFAPLFSTLLAFSVVASVLLGILLTRKILQPIKNIDLSHPIKTNPYAELHIFMQQISKQKKKIKKQLKSIKQGKMQFELITKAMNEGFLVLDRMGKISQSNAKALRMLGASPNENVFEKNSAFASAIKESIDSSNQAFEITLGEYFCYVVCMPIRIKDGLKAIVVLLFDKSQQRDILALRKEFSSNVTHELKTPLSSIMLSAEMLNSGLVAEADKSEFIAKIHTESKRLLVLIEKILKISFLDNSLEKNANILEKERVDLANIVRQILPSVESLAREKGIKIACDFGEIVKNLDSRDFESGDFGEFVILGIPALLEDMVYNLCENAIKYSTQQGKNSESGENGVVKISLKRENREKNGENSVILSVADNGIGIAPNEQERIFERFYCVDKSRSKNLGGNGLGLAIVKRIAKIHNAKIEVQSELGKGSEFVITFVVS